MLDFGRALGPSEFLRGTARLDARRNAGWSGEEQPCRPSWSSSATSAGAGRRERCDAGSARYERGSPWPGARSDTGPQRALRDLLRADVVALTGLVLFDIAR
jgi:hypothetical protein